MKTIGMIGGTSWSSTVEYYRLFNRAAAARLGGLHSAHLLIRSIDLAELEVHMHAGRWDDGAEILAAAARSLEAGGADGAMICSNLTHRMFDTVERAVSIPLFHIGDAVGAEIARRGLNKVALLGARETMEEDFYRGRIAAKSGAEILIPTAAERAYIDRTIFARLCRDIYTDEDRQAFSAIILGLQTRGAEAVILGCTELPLLLPDPPLPGLDCIGLHCAYVSAWAFAA